jgi:hypothetical protein
MKKLLISAVLTVLIATSSFAADGKELNSKVVDNFFVEFKHAKNVTWKSTENFVKASFILNDKSMAAFYDLDGNMIGTTSNIAIDDLPTNAKRAFAKKYGEYTVKEAIQFDGVEDTAYFISAESEKQTLLLKVSVAGFVSVLEHANK